MNPITSILELLSLKEKVQSPVHFSYIEPMIHPIPREVSEKYFNNGDYRLLTSYVGLENISNKVLTEVRIKLKSQLRFKPIVESNEAKNYDNYEFNEALNEVVIKKIDPKESIYLSLFPSPSKLVKNFEPDIIINGELLTRRMKRIGFYSKYPSLIALITLTTTLLLSIPVFMFYSNEVIDYIRRTDPSYQLIQDAHERVKGDYCTYQPIEVGPYLDWYLDRSPMPREYTYRINGVVNYDELVTKNEVVLCLTNTVSKRAN
ncbi:MULTISPECIES: hypothetical protein [unclassified Aeromonas]|uniref:hypothetical protein n=1 Tax=unclassified Aeromonas TaxID=257493 RepID=UPI003526DDB8